MSAISEETVRSSVRRTFALKAVRVERAAFYVSFALILVSNMISSLALPSAVIPLWEEIRDTVGVATVLLLLFKLMFQRYTPKSGVLTLITVCVGFLVRINTGDSTFLFLCLFAAASAGAKLKGLARTTGFLTIATIIFAALLWKGGVLGDASIVDPRSITGVRQSIGFAHPNLLGRTLAVCGVSTLLGSRERRGLGVRLGIVCLLMASHAICNSRTATLLLLAVLLLTFYEEPSTERCRFKLLRILSLIPVVLLVMSWMLMVTYDPSKPQFAIINTILSHRVEFWNAYWLYYSPAPFGSRLAVDAVLNTYGTPAQLDGAYVLSIIQYGVIPSIFIIYFVGSVYKLAKRESYVGILIPAYTVMLIVGVTENYVLMPVFNCSLLAIGCAIGSRSLDDFAPRDVPERTACHRSIEPTLRKDR